MWELIDTKLQRRLVALFMLLVTLVGLWQGLQVSTRVVNWANSFITPLQQTHGLGEISWRRYTNRTYEFQLQYPPDWELQETPATATTPFTLLLIPPARLGPSYTGHSSPTRLVLTVSKKRTLSELTPQGSDLRPILLNGHSGVFFAQAPLSSTRVAGEASLLNAHTIYINNKGYHFIFLMSSEENDRQGDNLQAILSNFRFSLQ